MAAGFLVFALGESLLVSGTAAGLEASVPSFGGGVAASSPIRRALDKAASDDTIKAVVLRVNSPGGSATASEIILDATRRVKAKKPLVVSMGDVAGSGGYYVAMAVGSEKNSGTCRPLAWIRSARSIAAGENTPIHRPPSEAKDFCGAK